MLSANKVKLHGMKDGRWTTRDKITQYKGLINLFTRDRKIMQVDTQVATKKQQQLSLKLHRSIGAGRVDLDNAVRGDKQQLRNALQDHKSFLLAYQDLYAQQIVDRIHQENFNKRKELDRLSHRMRLKTLQLVRLKLELAEAEDVLKYEMWNSSPAQMRSKIITAQVQDAILKKEAAISVRHIYRKILSIMKKDAIYFDAVLDTLKRDSQIQSNCMVRTVNLGQLATEYLDDRQLEFLKLEKVVKKDMKQRVKELDKSRHRVSGLNKQLRVLIRRDSDINLTESAQQYRTVSELAMLSDLDYMKNIFKCLQDVTKVTHYQQVYPCIQSQRESYERLSELVTKFMGDTRNFTKKTQHAQLMYYNYLYTMNENTCQYREEKAKLKEELKALTDKIEEASETIVNHGKLTVDIRRYLQHLLQKSRPVISDRESRKRSIFVRQESDTTRFYEPEQFEEEGAKIISSLITKLTVLAKEGVPLPPLQGTNKDLADDKFRKFILAGSRVIETSTVQMESDGLIEGITMDDAQIPTNESIKKNSKEIVVQNTFSEEDEQLAAAAQRRGRKK